MKKRKKRIRTRKVAAIGALAGLPWAVIVGLLASGLEGSNPSPRIYVAGLLTGLITGLPFGALGGVIFVKFQDKIPMRSTFTKAAVLCLILWILLVVPPWGINSLSLGMLVGLMVWAFIMADIVDRKTDWLT